MTEIQLVLQQVLAPVVGAVLTFLSVFLVKEIVQLTPYIKEFIINHVELVKSKLTVDQLGILDLVVTRAVQAVEQSPEIAELIKQGLSKKQAALNIIQDELDRRGVPFDLVDAEHRIEAAILQGLEQKPVGMATLESTPLASFQTLLPGLTPVVKLGDLPASLVSSSVSNG